MPRPIGHQQPLQLSNIDNRMAAAYLHRDFSNTGMEIDSWTTSDMRSQSDLAMSYSSGGQGQPPSIGNVRQIVVSEPSGGSQMYSDGQPPSVNDVGRREPSLSEASCTRYEGPDEHEVQQQVIMSESSDWVYKRGAAAGTSNEISAYSSGYDERTQDLVSRFGSQFSQPVLKVPLPHMTFNSNDFTINENGFLNGGVLFPPAQPFQRLRTNVKVSKRGSVGRVIDITAYSGYDHLQQELARMFGIAGQLEDQQRSGWKLVYVDFENDILLVGGDPWDEFVNCVRYIKILSSEEVQEMILEFDNNHIGDRNLGGSTDVPLRGSYGFRDGNKIQTGFPSLPDSSMLLAKYPSAFSNSSAKSGNNVVSGFQTRQVFSYKNQEIVQPFNGVSDPVAAIRMHYAKTEQ